MTVHQCPFCELRFANTTELEQHITTDHAEHIRLQGAPRFDQDAPPAEPQPHHPDVPRTWDEARYQTAEFEALLRKYDGDYQKAVDALLRGEHEDTQGTGMSNPM